MDFVLGIIAGLITSFAIYIYKVKFRPPSLEFGNELSRTVYADETIGFKYIYKNSGKGKLVDVSMKALIKIPGQVASNDKLKQVIRFNTNNHDRFVVDLNKVISNKLIIDMQSLSNNKTISFVLKDKLASNEDINIDTLLELSPDCTIQIFVLGNDEVTGLRRVFESKEYTKNCIRNGSFNRETMVVSNKANKSSKRGAVTGSPS